jgi:serine/threonine protein kinase/Tol biopolymer transport system component
MPVSPTPPLGRYKILSKIGAGGMGEVYRAEDPKLGRHVAIKVLPQAFARDADRMARFKREARLLASLNHSNIAAIYGVEDSESTDALVMELAEGETLAERIASGPIPLAEALPIALQIANALEYAHEHGVVHRDLKPANIKISPDDTVKILDFGLAKAMHGEPEATDPANSPTITSLVSKQGVLLGTPAYMSPEQAKGKQVDHRADIWAFGCVLYEMLVGKKAFQGETISDIVAAVIRAEPNWTALPETTVPPVRRLLRRCLQKDVRRRLQAMGEARIAIEEVLSGAGAEPESAISGGGNQKSKYTSPLHRAFPWVLGATAILVAIAAWLLIKPEPTPGVLRFPVAPPENLSLVNGGELSISPDGHYLAFVARAGPDKLPSLWLRPLDNLTAEPIPGTEGANMPFWSPDSRQIGFGAGGKLKKVSVPGGTPETLCDAYGTGGTWNQDGVILFASNGSLYRISDTGGTPTLVAAPDQGRHETAYRFPQFLPDGHHFLLQMRATVSDQALIAAGSLDSKTVQRIAQASTNALYAPPGYLFYLDRGTLMARPFNAKALRFTAPAVPVAQSVGHFAGPDYGFFSVSRAGVLAYDTISGAATSQLTWFNRSGKKLGTIGQPDIYATPALSPDGTRLAVTVGENGRGDIWIFDLKRGSASRLTFDPANEVNPVWSSDGSRIFFSSDRNGPYDIYQIPANGLAGEQPVFQSSDQRKALNDLTGDGRYLVYDTAASPISTQLWALPLVGDLRPFAFVQGSFGASSARFSPNGHYLAYTSTETGRNEIYVQTFPQHTNKWQISTAGGLEPIWRSDGKELFYLAGDGKLMSVDVSPQSATFRTGNPKPLFQAPLAATPYWRNTYVPSPDGQRFLMVVPASEATASPITVVVNWPAILKSGSR